MARQRALRAGRPAREDVREDDGQPRFGRESGQAGLHRLRDPKGDGSFTTVDTLRAWDGGEGGHSDHGIHEARVSPDGKYFYIINGNGVVQPQDMSPNSPIRNYADDRIIPLLGTQTGRLGHEKAPGGFIGARLRRQGLSPLRRAACATRCTSTGMPTAKFHVRQRHGARVRRAVVSAGAGLLAAERRRSRLSRQQRQVSDRGTEDTLPPLVEIGLGSPVGVTFGYRTAFPA